MTTATTSPAPSARDNARRIRAIGIDRISKVGDRAANDRLHSDDNQVAAIERECERNGFELIDVVQEHNVSGGAALAQRPFGEAIERVERGEADAIVFAYRDRSDRSIVHGSEAIGRMDAAGGILIAGGSVLTHVTADKRAEATMGSFMGEWQRRVIKEKSADGVAAAVALGRVPQPSLPLGLVRNDDGTARLGEPGLQELVRECFARRARGATIAAVRAYLAEHGVERSYRSVQIMLGSRLYVGEIRHGKHVNLTPGFDAIVDRKVWDAVQAVRLPGGRTAKSERLLARLGVLRCASCGARMVAGAQTSRWNGRAHRYTFYKCGRGGNGGCPAPCTISAEPVERLVLDRMKLILADGEGRASAAREARDAAEAAERAQAAFDAAVRAFTGLDDEPSVADKLVELRVARDETRAHADRLASSGSVKTIGAERVLDNPSPKALPAKRELIRALIDEVRVSPGRAPTSERLRFQLVQ